MIRFPQMREFMLVALARLSDREHQERAWAGPGARPEDAWDSLDQVIHVLFDDTCVLEAPDERVGTVIRQSEVAPLRRLADVFGPIIDELGDVGVEQYLAHPRWPAVVTAAGKALAFCLSDFNARGGSTSPNG